MDFEIQDQSEVICSVVEDGQEELAFDEEITEFDAEISALQEEDKVTKTYIQKYFQDNDSGTKECKICKGFVPNRLPLMLKHLKATHKVNKNLKLSEPIGRGRPSRSFIWKYCTRENAKQALCHICNKLLFFGGGNTSNIAKHLRRKHSDVLEPDELGSMEKNDETYNEEEVGKSSEDRKDKKISSYVWKYCEKIDKNSIRCKLCRKVMSFHGTANIITHLTRRHRITGKFEKEHSAEDEPFEIIHIQEDESKGRAGSTNSCNVWKYCKKLSNDVVRCEICMKKLSFQGTSNLQRHLQRMHGIDTGIRTYVTKEIVEDDDEDFWQFCEKLDNLQAKCNMCNFTCSHDEMRRHMIDKHAVLKYKNDYFSIKPEKKYDEEDFLDEDDAPCEEIKQQMSTRPKLNETNLIIVGENFKEELSLLDEMIEIDPDEENIDIFDPRVKLPRGSPTSFSSKSSENGKSSPNFRNQEGSQRLKELREELVISETLYFKEKASFYRMQKYLTALQAKKLRMELEQTKAGGSIATTITIDASDLSQHITQLP